MNYMYDVNKVLKQVTLKNISVKNRVVRSATNDYAGNTDGTITDYQIDICRELAKNEVGLLFTANFYVSDSGKADRFQNSIDDDCYISGMKKLTGAVHEHDCKIVAQISHAGAKANSEGWPLFVPFISPYYTSSTYELLSVNGIGLLVDRFIDAAYRAKRAGFDGIQLHCAHGYLLSDFISPLINKRTDLYGGSAENRFRIVREIIEGIKITCGSDFPVFIKINSNLPDNDSAYLDDLIYILNKCKESGVEAVELSGCDFTGFNKLEPPYYLSRGAELKKQVDIPIILVGGIRSFEDMNNVINKGVDMVSLSRPFICEPDLLPKLIAGQERAKCLSCNKCFTLYKTDKRRCMFN